MYRRDAGEILYFDTIDKMSKYLQIESRTQRYFTSARGGGKESEIYEKLKEILAPMVKLEVRKELEAELKKLADCLG